jgi:integration host factor subunit beta
MLTRDELVARICDKHQAMYIRDVDAAVDVIFDHIAGSLALGQRVEVRDFGSFSFRRLRAHAWHTPHGVHSAPDRTRVLFRAGKGIRRRLNPGATGTTYRKQMTPYVRKPAARRYVRKAKVDLTHAP